MQQKSRLEPFHEQKMAPINPEWCHFLSALSTTARARQILRHHGVCSGRPTTPLGNDLSAIRQRIEWGTARHVRRHTYRVGAARNVTTQIRCVADDRNCGSSPIDRGRRDHAGRCYGAGCSNRSL